MASPLQRTSDIWEHMPESKLELIDGRLVVGGSLDGSRYMLWALLQTLGPRAALALAPLELWQVAIEQVFRTPRSATPQAWRRWASSIDYRPLEPRGAGRYFWAHHAVYQHVLFELYNVFRGDQGLGMSLQRFLMRLGDNALQPDIQCFRRDRLHHLQTYFFDGPADIVIEIVTPDSEYADSMVKRRLYAAAGVPEYWLIDLVHHRFDVLQLIGGEYKPRLPDADGRVASASVPGLMLTPGNLWVALEERGKRQDAPPLLQVDEERVALGPRTTPNDDERWTWEWSAFTPPIGLTPTAISFDQFLTWCPEAKFELVQGRPLIGSRTGTKTTLGMLLMTFGLQEVVRLLGPQEWVEALLEEEADHQQDAARRDMWWNRAREVSALLREQFGIEHVAVIGDLLRPTPLSYWSELTIVAPDVSRQQRFNLYPMLETLPTEPRLDLCSTSDASSQQRAALDDAVWL